MAVHVRFSRDAPDEAAFHRELKEQVDAWFDTHNVSKKANAHMVLKTIVWVGASLTCLSWILSGLLPLPLLLITYGLMGFCFACIGFNVGHDAIHGAYSRHSSVNNLLSWSYELIGANARNWSHGHNVLHHTWTNVVGVDADIDAAPFLRLNPDEPLRWHHRYQHVYAWFLYMLFTLNWVSIGDWVMIRKPHPNTGKLEPVSGYIKLLIGKLSHFGLLLVLPAFVHGFGIALAGFLLFHMVGGLTLAVVFQLAHVVEGPEFLVPKDGHLPHRWAAMQVRTTANFCGDNPVVTFIVGGLDRQVEHHLFPAICHVHYPQISPIVKRVAESHGLTYHHHPTFWGAVASHYRQLKAFGTPTAG